MEDIPQTYSEVEGASTPSSHSKVEGTPSSLTKFNDSVEARNLFCMQMDELVANSLNIEKNELAKSIS